MWQQLQCNYYVELIIKIICDTVSTLEAEIFDADEFKARMSNLENSASTLQALLLNYKDSRQIPDSYVLLFAPLIEIKSFVKSLDLPVQTALKNNICHELLMYKKKLRSLQREILMTLNDSSSCDN